MISKLIHGGLFACVYTISTMLYAQPLSSQKNVLISVLKPPSPVSTLQGDLLIYELHITNNADKTLQLGLIEIMDEANKPLTSYSGTKLQQNSFAYENNKRLEDKNIILKKGMGAFVTIWLSQPMFTHIPKSLNHHIWFVEYFPEKDESTTYSIEYTLNVLDEKPVILGNPLKGTQWVASAALSSTSYHRLTILPIEGKFYLAQRYAIDWMQICADNLDF
ncbi:MAG TPA: hypothetical protein PLD88_00320 [Candidatus Berkiella sp.]|nr:hypothetical protein [Candidatus Berkiella sp.]